MSDFPATAPKLTTHKPKTAPRRSTTARGYGHHWQQVRKIKVQQNPLCELKLEGCTGWADQVHHRDGCTSNNAASNLCSACRHCHQLHHNRKRDD